MPCSARQLAGSNSETTKRSLLVPEQAAVRMKLWNVGAKVSDLDEEVKFIQALGGSLVLDEILTVEGQSIRVVLMRLADKYLHLFGKAVYESRLGRELPG